MTDYNFTFSLECCTAIFTDCYTHQLLAFCPRQAVRTVSIVTPTEYRLALSRPGARAVTFQPSGTLLLGLYCTACFVALGSSRSSREQLRV